MRRKLANLGEATTFARILSSRELVAGPSCSLSPVSVGSRLRPYDAIASASFGEANFMPKASATGLHVTLLAMTLAADSS